ncbi:MAG: phosphoenolpyruvate carboxylase [Gammaproteobacteria bacterium]|nr:phosphoenolpyruvate carboxylase [Gammaproteobacteria bacterium]MCP4089958.1 phosphoenolpyruvate carboxylase [Gammaproteobacteria bacterium]MCP4276289.1 phosphoenolpyruvate carboxylase [Gammaproteobacteria bacterium]MCP4831284.1 phosphoenolpyruvate carboxylase [Gammaproteobacteria bacterium]MCP4928767.1 phosphoenolpyruvate carboxylase [Gammaproteobacteria bacterium]
MNDSKPQITAATVKRQNIRFAEKDEALRQDVRALGRMVGELLVEQGGEALYKTVESARLYAIDRREGDAEASQKLDKLLGKMSATAARDVVRAFSTYFQVVNTAEQVHRIRRRRDYLKDTDKHQPRSLDETVYRLRDAGFETGHVEEMLNKLVIEPVFTPHPTETTRRTILRKQQSIVRRMVDMQNPAITPQEENACFESIRADITAIWQTEESPSEAATVFDELEHMLFFLTDVIYRVIPPFYEELDSALADAYGKKAKTISIPNLLHFGSWIGGDISTNQEFSARILRDTLARQRLLLLDLYYKDAKRLAEKLSQSLSRIDVDAPVLELIEEYSKQFPSIRGTAPHRYRNMPYRMLLRLIMARLQATYDDGTFPYEDTNQFTNDLKIIANSLTHRKGANAGLFAVRRLIRRSETFGFHLLSLDIRCNAEDLQHIIGHCLDKQDWMEQPPDQRADQIRNVLIANDSAKTEPDNDAKRLLSVFNAIKFCRRKYGQQAIGVILVRHCRGVDDVLAALLVARWAGLTNTDGSVPLDIAPCFETGEELDLAPALIEKLLQDPFYKVNLEKRGATQTVKLSTSEASGDGGIAASRWNMKRAHDALGKIFTQSNINYTLFHGRGSVSGRGGVSDGIACGHLRTTEHGEAVNERYGVRGIAFRTLEKAFSAVAIATAELESDNKNLVAWSSAMELISEASQTTHQQLTGSDSGFNDYFRLATPVDVIEHMRIGMRNSTKESDSKIFERNIPWTLAWSQSRHLFPAWYGFGTGLEKAVAEYGAPLLREMATSWPFFRRLINDVETALAITDPSIAEHYSLLAGKELHGRFFPNIQAEYNRSVAAILNLRQSKVLLENNNTLRRSIRLRNPYVDPMSLLQVELLKRWREGGRNDERLIIALVASVNGISHGLQTSS